MAMGDGASFDIDNVFVQPQRADKRNRDCRERLVDFNAAQIGGRLAGALQRLAHRRHGTEAEHLRFDGADAVRDKARDRL